MYHSLLLTSKYSINGSCGCNGKEEKERNTVICLFLYFVWKESHRRLKMRLHENDYWYLNLHQFQWTSVKPKSALFAKAHGGYWPRGVSLGTAWNPPIPSWETHSGMVMFCLFMVMACQLWEVLSGDFSRFLYSQHHLELQHNWCTYLQKLSPNTNVQVWTPIQTMLPAHPTSLSPVDILVTQHHTCQSLDTCTTMPRLQACATNYFWFTTPKKGRMGRPALWGPTDLSPVGSWGRGVPQDD